MKWRGFFFTNVETELILSWHSAFWRQQVVQLVFILRKDHRNAVIVDADKNT